MRGGAAEGRQLLIARIAPLWSPAGSLRKMFRQIDASVVRLTRRVQPLAAGLLTVVASISATGVRAMEYSADIVISGGAFAAPAAALAAARTSPEARILLIEPTDWLGGQATSQGVSAIDNAWFDPGASLMRDNPAQYYPADYLDWLERIRSRADGAPGTGMGPAGTCWVSREPYDPRTAAWALDRMVEEHPNITVLKMTVVKKVAAEDVTDRHGAGRRITGLTLIQRTPQPGYVPFTKFLSRELPDWFDPKDSADFRKEVHTVTARDSARGLVVIDASETADVIVLSGAVYTVGREKTTEEIGPDGSLPEYDETGSQATVFPFCMTDSPTTDSERELKEAWSGFDDYYAQQEKNYFGLGKHTWTSVWTYRRLKLGGPGGSDTVNRGDVSMQNWYPGNDYPYGSIYLTKAQAAAEAPDWRGGLDLHHLAEAEKHAVAWYFWMKKNRPTPWDTRFLRGTDSLNMMGTPHGLSKFPYIRCGRRIVGLGNFRIMERDLVDTQGPDYTTGTTSRRYDDSVGIGAYACDVHAIHDSEGLSPAFERPAPFYIPYRALGSANVRNLLAGGKTMAATYITNSAYRLHPIEWAAGSAAGTAAALMAREARSNLDLLEAEALRELQRAVAKNSPISWAAWDRDPIPADANTTFARSAEK